MEDIRVGILQTKENYEILKFRKEQGRKGNTPQEEGSISPHKVWTKMAYNDIQKLAKISHYSFDSIVDLVTSASNEKSLIDKFVNDVAKFGEEKVMQAVKAANVYITLANAKEFYISQNTTAKITDNISNGNWRKTMAEIKDFKLPFEEIIITTKDNKNNRRYDYFFISTFRHEEKYVHKDGRAENIFVIKECLVNETGTREGMTIEFFIVPSLLPRVFINCANMDRCKNCVRVDFVGNFEFFKSMTKGISYIAKDDKCKKSIRNSHMCDNFNMADKSLQLLYTVSEIMKQYYKKPVEIPKYSDNEGHDAIHQVHKKEESIIYIIGKTYTYIDNDHKKIRNKGGHHDSPCEHERTEHFRHYKNGKIVRVRSSKVNEGGKKSKVVL